LHASDPAPDLVALGEPMAEFAAETPGRLGEVRLFRRGYGGDTSNVVVAAARMGARGGYVTRVGDDEFGRAFLALWRAEGIDTRQVIVEPGSRTGVYFIARHAHGHDFTYYRGDSAASHLSPADLDRAYLAAARVLHTSGITQAVSPSSRQAAEAAMQIVRSFGGAVSYDVNYRPALWPPETARPAVEAACAQATLVFLSEEDAAALYAGAAPEDAAARLLGLGPQLVVLKRGARGCLILAATGERHDLPGWPVEAVDTTGAGDAFAGAFVAAWLEGARLDDAGRLANAVGALTATGVGAVEPIPRRPQVMAFIREQQARTQHRRE
jgi:2-dehydro-3-deoxygluconokinase